MFLNSQTRAMRAINRTTRGRIGSAQVMPSTAPLNRLMPSKWLAKVYYSRGVRFGRSRVQFFSAYSAVTITQPFNCRQDKSVTPRKTEYFMSQWEVRVYSLAD